MSIVRKRGITEKILYVLNPLPKTSDAELLKSAGLDLTVPSNLDPFQMHWKWGAGFEEEDIILASGESIPLRESEAKEMLSEFAELGAVTVPNFDDDAVVNAARVNGLRRAHRFYADRGNVRIAAIRRGKGIAKEDMEDMKYDLWPYHVNQAKADAIAAEIKRLQKAK